MHIDDVHHPIIDKPWEYQVVRFDYQRDPADPADSFVDLTLTRGKVTRRLRFRDPRDLEIEKGFPTPTGGLVILDVNSRQLEGIGVQVTDFEASGGAFRFWARDVIDLDERSGCDPAEPGGGDFVEQITGQPGDLVIRLTEAQWLYVSDHVVPCVEGGNRVQTVRTQMEADRGLTTIVVSEDLARRFLEACVGRFTTVGRRPDDEPNAEGLFIETLIDKFNPASYIRARSY